ncbi:urea ABC transporter ATP-binding protein UrtD [Candidatus Poribacteria bacterium]|jgi:urea transport system ATP-binding protein|nr:urea ABC transporter ATP-binding protein UrtD [Candidatus Poribacteria bacterium]MBT5710873.1 urea ABC transporter ATP-binding protein UrtD [Candidatus Poribacteria bacterium]MBT7100902.1 urea ABC transporter ATP-binding protein UrtD [Candidatus Poribacteria bacterium]MBT7808236.1 urea ABC transporter ATP-binding protein UrtD [Candidatus Poribacteria bacterium]
MYARRVEDATSDTILYIEGLTVSFDGFKALNDLDFFMGVGELRVIIGPNGAGKTTLLDTITGKVRPTEGTVLYNGVSDLATLTENAIVNLGIGRKFQTPTIYVNHTVFENLALSLPEDKGIFRTIRSMLGSHDGDRIADVLNAVGLSDKADDPAGLLSHGEKQWLEIGMLIAQDPRLLLLDEPVAGMTDYETQGTVDLIHSLADSHSILVIEHDMDFVEQIARTVTVLHEGSSLCEGTMDEVKADPRVVEVYLGRG